MVPVKLRVAGRTKQRLERIVSRLPHLSMNAYLNEIILEKLNQLEATKAKK